MENETFDTLLSFKLKSGERVPVGCDLTWTGRGGAQVEYEGRTIKISAKTAAKVLEVDFPSDEDLARWVCDSLVYSVMGEQVEPDGYDCYGSPSWLLALGII